MRGGEAENKIQIQRFRELADTAGQKHCVTHTNFLNLAEQSLFYEQTGSCSALPFTVAGGYPQAERRVVLFGIEDAADTALPVSLIQISRKNIHFTEPPSHRDYLGALLNLGIKRELLGDILPGEDGSGACVFCMESICAYLCENLCTVRRDTVSCRQIFQLPPQFACKISSDIVTAASERLDAIVAAVWHLSRGQSYNYFTEGKVFVNGRCVTDNSRRPHPGEIISVRGVGRFQYAGVVGDTKKGRCRIEIMRYL